jgi:transposase
MTIKSYDKIIARLDEKMLLLVSSAPHLQQKLLLLEQFKGVGRVTALQILAHMPELGSLSRREVAALAGVAPYARDSGKMRGIRRIYGGREIVRNSLFMVAMSAAKSNLKIKAYYKKLKAKGKKSMVALTACMRKIITILNAIIRDNKIILT